MINSWRFVVQTSSEASERGQDCQCAGVEKDVDGITDLSMAGVSWEKIWDTHHVRQVPA